MRVGGSCHVNRPEDLDLLKDALLARPRAETPTPECLDDETVAAFAEGTLDGSARRAVLPHLAECSRCRGAVASVSRALADPAMAREVSAVEGGTRRRFYRIALPVAAAALLVLVFSPRRTEDPGQAHRAPTITASAAPVPQAPVGAVADAGTLRWGAVAGSEHYRVTLFDAAGGALYEVELDDTLAVLPDWIVLSPGRRYLWQVEARTGFDRWATSPLVEFTVLRGPAR
jgi:hypothetical protein